MSVGPHRVSHTGSSEAVEDYVKAIYSIATAGDGAAVGTNDLADRLGVTAASVSAMFRKLTELGLADHMPYKGVRLTAEGERLALEVLRHHRLLELYLAEHLGVPWDRVHEEADALEHVISADLEARIAAKLGHPTHDPHGAPIPSAELLLSADDTQSLAALAPGTRGTFARIAGGDPEMLRYLDAQGIRLGDTVQVMDRQPFGGPATVSIGVSIHTIGGGLADAMRVSLE
ncbi:HTH-type transcriptional regulator MntR [Paraconexibacter sp. AEG42_29]|uniref:Manganese transport regulator n=1 Tax=Paraconexibacter sp. AEG42_29 TaxID=2997339 RepID=A0AAU7AT46_9ACTN